MRVYTNRALAEIWSYAKLAATLAILVLVVTQAVKLWGNDSNLNQIKNLTEQAQPKP